MSNRDIESEEIDLLEPELEEGETLSPHDIKFWKTTYETNKETGKARLKSITINKLKLLKVFFLLGFRRLDIDDQSTFIRIENNRVIKRININQVVDTFFEYLDEKDYWFDDEKSLNLDMIKEKFIASPGSYFKEDKLYRLNLFTKEKIVFNTDTLTEKFLYYKNGYVRITKAGVDFNDYSKLDKYIWESEVLTRNFTFTKYDDSYVGQFVTKICQSEASDINERIKALKIIMGYYMHSFTDCKLVSLMLTDSKISDENEANGRTGKSLFCKLIGYMLSKNPEDLSVKTFIDISGKNFDPKEKHRYQDVGYETKIVVLNDLKKYFDVDCVYNDVTEGVTVERKNMSPYRVKLKMILTTNKTVKIEGDSSKDRFLEFEFSDYFSKRRTPEMEFRHWFFRDWDADQWAQFDNYMISCVQDYFVADCKLMEPEHINLNARKLKENTAVVFLDYMSDLKIQFNQWYNKADLFNGFIKRYPDYDNQKFKQMHFTGWVKLYTKYMPEFEEFNKERDEKRSDDVIEMMFRKASNVEDEIM
ncbi:hypothetical protein ACTJKC_15140 [Pedobacter sp. 22226]|uniref:hypothetical protein n=1 Tax=Pedobacter sp. 22226 TaxID=3453894 RepID=UPI003F859377